MNRGSADGRPVQCYIVRGFNEAPIHESGKCRLQALNDGVLGASMRPRFMNRGSDQLRALPR